MTLRELVDSITRERGWTAGADRERPSFSVPQGNGRQQAVLLSEFSDSGEPMVRMITKIGPVDALHGNRLKSALELNLRLPHGCLAIDGQDLVMTLTRPLRSTTAKSSGDAIAFIARQADTYEKSIFGMDVH